MNNSAKGYCAFFIIRICAFLLLVMIIAPIPAVGKQVMISINLERGMDTIWLYCPTSFAIHIANGPHRGAEAVARGKRALDELRIDGFITTIPFHKWLLDNGEFLAGKAYTNFIESNYKGE